MSNNKQNMSRKKTIKIKSTWLGEDKLNLKNGDSFFIILPKQYLLRSYQNNDMYRQLNDAQQISLITYVRNMIEYVRKNGPCTY